MRRELFDIPEGVIYLDGNSLGAPPKHVAERVQEVVKHQWGTRLIRSWSEGWWEAPQRIGDRVGRLIGAAPGQVVVGDSTSVNVFKALMGAVKGTNRTEIVVRRVDVPDRRLHRAVRGVVGGTEDPRRRTVLFGAHRGHRRRAAQPRRLPDRRAVRHEVAHRTGACRWRTGGLGPLPQRGRAADRTGRAPASTSRSAAPTSSSTADRVRPPTSTCRHTNRRRSRTRCPAGTATARRSRMEANYEPDPGIVRARVGTPDILSMLALDAALDVWDDVDLAELRQRGLALTALFRDARREADAPRGDHAREQGQPDLGALPGRQGRDGRS